MHPHTLRNRNALALLAAPSTIEEAQARLAATHRRMLDLDSDLRVSNRRMLTETKRMLGEVQSISGFAARSLFGEESDRAATLGVECDKVHAALLHLRHVAARNISLSRFVR